MIGSPRFSDFAVHGEQALVALYKIPIADLAGNLGCCIFQGKLSELLVHGNIELLLEVVCPEHVQPLHAERDFS